MIVKMIQDLRKTIEKLKELFTKDLEKLKNKQTEMNNTLEGINSRITGGHTGGNHCCRTEYRRKNEKKCRQPKRPLGH